MAATKPGSDAARNWRQRLSMSVWANSTTSSAPLITNFTTRANGRGEVCAGEASAVIGASGTGRAVEAKASSI